ncbi:MAG: efflux RND transporter periplasmic adaptor subunit, partial [Flavisolibacter sp.]
GRPAKGTVISLKGMSDLLTETLSSLQTGLLFAVVVIFLLLAANYESFKLGGVVLFTVPAVIMGSLIFLLATGSTLNLQSYMGMIMSIGVSVANAILIVTNAEKLRLEYGNAQRAAIVAAAIRLRPILMTSFAMIAGMIPMASGLGEAGEQTAPLGRAVIGGLFASTLAALFILPLAFAWVQNKSSLNSPSLLPKLKTMKQRPSLAQLSIIIIVLSFTIISCSSKQKPVDLTVKSSHQENKIELTTVRQSSMSSFIKLPGNLLPFQSVDIFPKVSGFVKQVYVDRGSPVKKGQVLMTLEAPEINQQVQTARANLSKAKEQYLISKEKYERLLQTSKTPGTVSPFDLSSAQSKMQSDEANLKAEESSLKGLSEIEDYLVVRAPFTGVITERNIHPGALVGPSVKNSEGPMLSLQQLNKLRLTVNIPEAVVADINNKGWMSFSLSAYPEKEFKAKIARQSGVITSNLRSETIELDVDDNNGEIKPGMYAEVKIPIVSSANSFIVPASSIVHSTKGVYVIGLNEQNKTVFLPVQEGINSNDSTQVYGQLTATQKIVLHPSSEMEEGFVVK